MNKPVNIAVEDKIMAQMSPEIKQSKDAPMMVEIGNTGINRWGGNIYEEFLTTLRWPYAGKIYKEMSSNDPVVGAILLVAHELIREVTWDVEPASTSKADMEAADFLKSCMDDMSAPWDNIIDEIISYFDYGWAYHEIVYKKRLGAQKDPSKNSKYNDGRIGWRKIPGRSQGSWGGWSFDESDDGSINGMYQQTNAMGKVLIPIQKSLLFRTTTNRGNPEGKSFLRNSYRPWYFKKHIEEIEGIGIERDLAGLPVVTVPEGVNIFNPQDEIGQQVKEAAERMVKNIRRDRDEGVVLPFGWDLKLLSASLGGRQFDTNAIINRYDQRIAITMLSDIVMLGADKVGSFALANVKKSLLATSLDAQVHDIASIFNRYAIPRLFSFNTFVGLTDYPKVKASPVDCPSLDEVGNYIQKLSGAKMPLFPNIDLENYLRSIANFPLTDENDPARKAAMDANKNNNDDNNNNDDKNNDDNNNNDDKNKNKGE